LLYVLLYREVIIYNIAMYCYMILFSRKKSRVGLDRPNSLWESL